jgi:hypothetical protein
MRFTDAKVVCVTIGFFIFFAIKNYYPWISFDLKPEVFFTKNIKQITNRDKIINFAKIKIKYNK